MGEERNLSVVLIRYLMRPASMSCPYLLVVSTVEAFVCIMPLSVFLWEIECGDSSSLIPFVIRTRRSSVAFSWFVYFEWDWRSHPIFTWLLEDNRVGLNHTLLLRNQ